MSFCGPTYLQGGELAVRFQKCFFRDRLGDVVHHFVRSWDGGLAVVPSSQAATHDVQVAWGRPKMNEFLPCKLGRFWINKTIEDVYHLESRW